MLGPARQIPCFALNGSHAAGQKLLRNTDVSDGQSAGAVFALPLQKAGFGTAEGDGLIRLHNDANVLALGALVTGPGLALIIVDLFLDTPFSGEERHKRRISQLEQA